MYVFNFNDEQGFAVVSANRQTEGLIAAVEMGSYDPAIPTGNPGFDTYMQMAKVYVANTEVIEKEAKVTTTKSSQGIQMCKPVYDTVFLKKINPRSLCDGDRNNVWGNTAPMEYADAATQPPPKL